MKKFFTTGLLCILLGVVYMYKDDFIRVYKKHFVKTNTVVQLTGKNSYYRDYNFNYVQITDNFSPHSKQDLYNIYYTAINAGKERFTFYCPEDYKSCINDVKYLANDQITLSNINNFVHPFNSFKHIETSYDTTGKITIRAYHAYTDEDIEAIKQKVLEIKSILGTDISDVRAFIKKYHDFIIDKAIYDSARSDNNIINYKSDIAYGTLLQGYSLCGGYADSMAIFLDEVGIINYKVSSDHHVWNAVKIDDNWYHLDLTWDDPVTQDGTNLIESDFFLIDTLKLREIEVVEHTFDENVYSELKQK